MAAPGEGSESLLPAPLCDLLARSESLYRRIARLDEILFGQGALATPGVQAQFSRLEQAFGGE